MPGLKSFFTAIVASFTILVLSSFFINYESEKKFNDKILLENTRSIFDKDLTFRRWITMHGGVYVPITEATPPNPYLTQVPNRDLNATTGERLTLMNPAYALRQFLEYSPGLYGEEGKITSLKLLNEENAPDAWERDALERLARSPQIKELSKKTVNAQGALEFRYIQPLFVRQGCLKCHAAQGYKVGDLRGGISIRVPAKHYQEQLEEKIVEISIYHAFTWLIGLLFIAVFYHRLQLANRKERGLNRQIKNVYNLFNDGQIVLFRWNNDEDWSIDYVSDNVEAILGYRPKELLGRTLPYANLVHEKDLPKIRSEVLRAIDAGRDNITHQPYRITAKDGRMLWVYDSMRIIRNAEGAVQSFVGYVQDMTQTIEDQQKIARMEERFRLAMESTRDGLWDWNPKTDEVFFSASWQQMLGYAEDEIAPEFEAWRQRVHPDDIVRTLADIRIHLEGKTPFYETTHRLRHRNGSWLWIYSRGKALFDAAGKPYRVIGFHTDITRQKEMEQEIKALNRNLEARIQQALEENLKKDRLLRQQSKLAEMGEMIGAIAHQWRQPLNALSINIQNLDDDFAEGLIDAGFIDRFIAKNRQTITFMSKTIDDFRDFFRIDKNKEPFSVRESIEATASILGAQLRQHAIALEIEGEDFKIEGYRSEFQQVILNLVGNAKDALIDNSVSDGRIKIALTEKTITITDNAGGIPEPVIERIFEPYFTTKEPGKGTGIGLYMSKMIIEENMDGKLSVRNGKKGAEFRIEFKFAE